MIINSEELVQNDRFMFKTFSNEQKSFIQSIKLIRKYNRHTRLDITPKLVNEILMSIYNIRLNNYFIFYFENNQFGKDFVLNWFEIVLKSELNFQDTKLALNTLSLILRLCKNLEVQNQTLTITEHCNCLPNWSKLLYKRFFTKVLLEIHSATIIVSKNKELMKMNEMELIESVMDLTNYAAYFVPVNSLIKSNFLKDSIDFMFVFAESFHGNFLNTLHLMVYDRKICYVTFLNEFEQIRSLNDLKISLVYFLNKAIDSAALETTNGFDFKLFDVLYEFCIQVEDVVGDISTESVIDEIIQISNEVFKSFICLVKKILTFVPFHHVHIKMLIQSVKCLKLFLNNQLAANSDNQTVELIYILINILQLVDENLILQEKLNQYYRCSFTCKFGSRNFLRSVFEIKILRQRLRVTTDINKRTRVLFANDKLLNRIQKILQIFDESKNYSDLCKVCVITESLVGVLNLAIA